MRFLYYIFSYLCMLVQTCQSTPSEVEKTSIKLVLSFHLSVNSGVKLVTQDLCNQRFHLLSKLAGPQWIFSCNWVITHFVNQFCSNHFWIRTSWDEISTTLASNLQVWMSGERILPLKQMTPTLRKILYPQCTEKNNNN